MHEFSLIRALLQQVSGLLAAHEGDAVETVHLEIGPLSGVERALLELAFAQLVDDSPCRGATLRISEVPLTARCRTCGREFRVERFCFACPDCGDGDVQVTSGEAVRLLDVDLAVDAASLSGKG